MTEQVTVTDLRRRAAKVIGSLREDPVIVSRRGRPVAVILAVEAYEQMEQALADAGARQVRERIEAGLSSYRAGRTSPQTTVARRVRAAAKSRSGFGQTG
jgi:prevent-host-death family protein